MDIGNGVWRHYKGEYYWIIFWPCPIDVSH